MLVKGYTVRLPLSTIIGDKTRKFRRTMVMATVTAPSTPIPPKDTKKRMPITILSGFLGSGKTSFLQRALENDKGTKFGLLINDMASVNIDSKLIAKTSSGFDGVDTMELQNGCVCCTLAEDMLVSLSNLVTLAEQKNIHYDHVVVECSGIAEPRKIRELFQAAEDYGELLLEKIRLDTLVTVVDASVFLELFGTVDDLQRHSTLAMSEEEKSKSNDFEYNTGLRKVTDLLLEQVECADTVLINKIDLLPKGQESIDLVRKVIKSVNPTATVIPCIRGDVDTTSIVGSARGEGAASMGFLDEHRKLIQSVESQPKPHGVEGHVCDDGCAQVKDTGHSHDHSHTEDSHDHAHNSDCQEDHSHSHDHGADGHACDSTCTHPSHSHSHDHVSDSHDHSHSHEHTTAETRFGITSFVYRRRRPFHPTRFTSFLQSLGKLSVKGLTDAIPVAVTDTEPGDGRARLYRSEEAIIASRSLVRSKGFVWMATSAAAAYFMSHAGQYLELVVLGRWWADIKESDWPEGSKEEITIDFDGAHGDRRQELVFIGQFDNDGGRSGNSQKALEELLDSCLLTDSEMVEYEGTQSKGDAALRSVFFKGS